MSVDSSYGIYKAIVSDVEQSIDNIKTEEDAKIQIILRIFFEVLGWKPADIGAERKHDNGFSDFIVSEGSAPVFLCEAKRLGRIRIDTADTSKVRHLKLDGPALSHAREGIQQAASYAAPKGIFLTALTDGKSWVIFKSVTPGSDYSAHEAFVFPSFQAISNDFSVFYELLSRESNGSRLYNVLFDQLHNNRSLLSHPLKAPVSEYDIHLLNKSELAFDLDQIFQAFFGRLGGDHDDNMLIDCFVESRESRFADFSLEKMAANVLGNISPRDKDVGDELRILIEAAVDVEGGQTVFIVGPTGSGKSTFLERFFRKTLTAALRERCVVVRVNCLDSTGREDTALQWLTDVLISNFERQLYEGGSPTWEQLRGLYFAEYDRRRKGVDANIYNRDKDAFREKFSTYLDDKVENDREGYLRRILTDIVHSRRMLPVLILDNTDEFSPEFKVEVFQFAQALRRTAGHCIIMFPVTDKSAWSFAKTEIYNIYKSRSFFLPTPPPREVFRKRIDFIRAKNNNVIPIDDRKSYFIGRGIRLSIDNIANFAAIVEDAFVDNDLTSRVIGELSNYNIRKTLELAQRIITSSTLQIDDIFKSFAVGQFAPLSHQKFFVALLLGDYQFYRQTDNRLLFPVFQIGEKFKQSPLLMVRVLALLENVRRGARNVEDSHIHVQSILDYFSAMGHAETGIEQTLVQMKLAGLIEAYDPSIENLLPGQRLAITSSGNRHLELALYEPIYFDQMAVTTAITDASSAEKIADALKSSRPVPDKFTEIRSLFSAYLIAEDAANMTIPEAGDEHAAQRTITAQIQRFAGHKGAVHTEEKKSTELTGMLCIVDWFDPEKGFGFVEVEGQDGQAFIRREKLSAAGIDKIFDGDRLLCDIGRNLKGMFVNVVHDFEGLTQQPEQSDAEVIRIFHDRKYGFVKLTDKPVDAFFHFSVFGGLLPDGFREGSTCRVSISRDRKGLGYEVRSFLTLSLD